MPTESEFRGSYCGWVSRRGLLVLGGLSPVAAVLLGGRAKANETGAKDAAGTVPAKVGGRWPNDARDTFWYGDHATASRVARASRRPTLLVINRGAECQV